MVESHDITIIWAPNTEIDLDFYNIYRSFDNTTFVIIGQSKSPSFIDKDLPELRYTILAVAQGPKKFTIQGNYAALFPAGAYFKVTGSTGNDLVFTVASSADVTTTTEITVAESIPDANADGEGLGFYYYKITAVDKSGNESTFSTMVPKTSPPDSDAPTIPTGLYARGLIDWTGVELFWDDNPETDIKGYIIYRSYDGVTYHIAGTSSKNSYKDTKIPLGLDPIYAATDVIYAVGAYDKDFNVSALAGPEGIFQIPLLQKVKVNIDYLSLNVSWQMPRPEDGVEHVDVWYKKKTDSSWTYGGAADYPTSKFRIDGPLDKDTEYDVALQVLYSPLYTILAVSSSTDSIQIDGEHDTLLSQHIGQPSFVFNSGWGDGQWTIQSVSIPFAGRTQINFVEDITSISSPLGTYSLGSIHLQPNTVRVVIPDYETDTTPPTDPYFLVGRQDPDNDRVYLTWSKIALDDDFYTYEISIYTGGSYRLHGSTRDNNYTLNNASAYVDTGLISFQVRAVDRSGNVSVTTLQLQVPWSDVLMAASNDYRPQWIKHVTEDPSRFYDDRRRYNLVWNDAGRASPFFDRYVLLIVEAPKDEANPQTLFGTPLPQSDEILVETQYSEFDFNRLQPTTGPAKAFYIWVGVITKFGAYYFYTATNDAIVEMQITGEI